ncbi:MAG: lipoprotein [Colwellia sp.]|nr:lipoprotein [Colwellia sp.]
MHTNRLHYFLRNLNIKSILLAIIAIFLVSACGIKGDLYQTPEQVITEQSTEQGHEQSNEKYKIIEPSNKSQEPSVTTLDEADKKPAVQQELEQADIPAAKQSTEQIKE